MEKLRLIQCGVGGMGKAWWEHTTRHSPDFDLVAIVDVNERTLNEAGEALALSNRFTSLESALDSTVCDAILTVTPPPIHAEHASLAFSHGLHVLTEKPIAHDLESAKKMVAEASRADRQLVVAQNYRYKPAPARLKTLLAEKPLGEFGHGHIDFYMPADFGGSFRKSMPYPLLIDMAIHHIDLIRAVTGRNITRVIAQTFNPSWSWFDHHAELKMLLELEGGAHFSYSGDWTARGRSTSWNGNWRIQCADGSIHLEDDKITIARCDKWGNNPTSQPIEIPPLPRYEQAAILHNFAQTIRSNQPAETSGQDNLQSFATVTAAVMSAQQHRPVDVPPLLR